MLKRFVTLTLLLTLIYIGVVNIQLHLLPKGRWAPGKAREKPLDSHIVYRFSFSKYKTTGDRELEIEGDSADMLSHEVRLQNVIAKAYADETPVIVTANHGTFTKETGAVHLHENVVATTDTGARLLTEALDLHADQKRMETEVEAEVKTESVDVRGTKAESDSNLKKIKFHKNVTVTIRDANHPEVKPTLITCDGPLNIDYAAGVATFNTNVVAIDERGELKSDRMDVYQNHQTEQVEKIVATGNVEIKKPDGSSTFSESVVYYVPEGRMILGGDPEALMYQTEEEEETSNKDGEKKDAPPADEFMNKTTASGTPRKSKDELPAFIVEGLA